MEKRTVLSTISTICIIFILAVWTSVYSVYLRGGVQMNNDIVVWVFNIGQGDAILIDSPNGQVLVDGGPNAEILDKLSMILPPWDRTIELIINSHPHADHLSGINYVLKEYNVYEVWSSGQEYNSDVNKYFEEASFDFEIVTKTGYKFDLGSDAYLEVVYPFEFLEGQVLDDANSGSIVVRIVYGEVSVLLTGDIGADEEEMMLDEIEHVDILKVGHHGSRSSSSWDFLEKVTPDYSIISAGENNSYGHPHKEALDRLNRFSGRVLRTDQDGDIRSILTGKGVRVRLFDL